MIVVVGKAIARALEINTFLQSEYTLSSGNQRTIDDALIFIVCGR